MATLYSAGYQRTASPAAFAAHLARHGVDLAIDVRRRPTSQRPGYDRAGLGEAIEYRGIMYRSVPDLGNLDALGDVWHEDADRARTLLAEHFVATQAPLLGRLAQVCATQTVCLVCVCPTAAQCHRRAILIALDTLGIPVAHQDISPA